MIAGYESQLLEFAVANPQDWEKIKGDIVMVYPTPTVWSSHVYIALDENGKKIYDDSIDRLKQFFGAYRTLKIMPEKPGDLAAEKLDAYKESLIGRLPGAKDTVFSVDGEWLSILIPEDKLPLMNVVSCIDSIFPVRDIRIDEISTESVIRKIYEEAEAMRHG